MLKVLSIVDKEGTALDRLAKGVAKYHSNLDYQVLAVHPKRPDPRQLQDFEEAAAGADIIDWQYYRTAEMLRAKYAWLSSKVQILTHNNPYSITESDWNGYDAVVGNNKEIYDNLAKITNAQLFYIPITVDADFWTFNPDWEPNKTVIMVANRIEGKKGILPVAIACADAGLKLILVGAISDMNYMDSIMATGSIEFHRQITDAQVRELYYKSTIHVCNSVDNFESGTMPILESMLCGVPVLTRNVGHVPELNNAENMVLLEGDSEDVQGIQDKLEEMLMDKKKLSDLRERAWQTAKVRNFERRAYQYQKLYRQVLYPEQQSVSVIVPIYNKPEIVRRTLDAIAEQSYKNIELIVCNDSLQTQYFEIVEDFRNYVNFPVRYLYTARGIANGGGRKSDYGLARARNEALIEATGEIVVFCDQRIIMEPDAIEQFVQRLKKRYWLYGSKGAKKEFVENFSCAYRDEVIRAGMFCERINEYGGQSQEIRERIRSQGMQTEYVPEAKAQAAGKSANRNRKRASIIRIKNRLSKMYEL